MVCIRFLVVGHLEAIRITATSELCNLNHELNFCPELPMFLCSDTIRELLIMCTLLTDRLSFKIKIPIFVDVPTLHFFNSFITDDYAGDNFLRGRP